MSELDVLLSESLPSGWHVSTLAKSLIGSDIRNSIDPGDFPTETFDYYSIPAYQEYGTPVEETGARILSQKLVVDLGDVLFCKLNPRVPKIWRVTRPSSLRKVTSTEFLVLTADPSCIDSTFLYYLVQSDYVLPRAQTLVTGSTPSRQRVDRDGFFDIQVPLPALPEQRRIAAVLNTIQDAIAAQEDVIAAAKEFKWSLMHRLFTVGPGRELAPTKETLFGDVPAHWGCVVLDHCAEVQTGLAKGRRYRPDEKTVTLPYLRVANVQDGYLDLSEIKTVEIREDEVDRYRLEPGDMLMTEGGDFDKLGRGFIWDGSIADCLHQNHVFAVRADRARLMPEFLAYLAQSAYGKGYFLSVAHRTTNLASINSTKLKALPVLLPSLEEQSEVVNILQVTDAKIAAEEDRLTAMQALFKSMLHQLMTGQIRLLSDEGLPLA
ncbi:MAG: restriction endonuclease subunit S [Caldilineaceae bacterium]